MEGLGTSSETGSVRIARTGQLIDLELKLDGWASRNQHVRMGLDDGGLFAEDEEGLNGTWLKGGRISGRIPLGDGVVLVVGRTPVQVSLSGEMFDHRQAVSLPSSTAGVRELMDAATRGAQTAERPFVDAIDLLIGVLTDPDEELSAAMGDLDIRPQQAIEKAKQRWHGDLGWISEFLAGAWVKKPDAPLRPTPKVVRVIARALEHAAQTGDSEPTGLDVLAALAEEPRGLPAEALSAGGLRADALAEWIASHRRPRVVEPDRTTPPPEPEELTTRKAPEPAPSPPTEYGATDSPAPFRLESWSDFYKAKELHDRIRAVQASFHLADPDERRAAIMEVLRDAFEQVVPERRDGVLRQLNDLFPVPEGMADPEGTGEEVQRLEAENASLRARLNEVEGGRPSGPGVEEILRMVTDLEGDGRSLEGQPPGVQVLYTIYRFTRDVERFTSSVVQSFHTRGGDVTQYVIPPFQRNLRSLLGKSGRAVDEDVARQVNTYLSAVRQWLVASHIGYSNAASRYCEKILKQVDPRGIEQDAKLSRWREAMGLTDAELWKRFKEIYADIQLDLVDDHVQEQAGVLASEEYEKLRSNKPKGRPS